MNIPNFNTKKELFDFLTENKQSLMAQKKAAVKYSDGVSFTETDSVVNKANKPVNEDVNEIKVRAIINTTNILDSHGDVHIPGLWGKSLKENRNIMHLQEHQLQFDKIIADGQDLKAYAQTYTWKELGYKFNGETQALVFDSTVKADVNKFMFDQYKKARVKNHSVGMQYVKLAMAVNDSDYKDEFATWEKYYPQIVNKEQADAQGYFFAVTEAKVIEGSAVPIGSNYATPTLENNMKSEPPEGTQIEPDNTTQITKSEFKQLIKSYLK